MESPYTIVHRTSDPIEADILGDLLTQSGILARVLGTRNAPLIGVAQHIMELRIEVPSAHAKEALEIIDAYHGQGVDRTFEGLDDGDGDGDDQDDDSGSSLAAGASPISEPESRSHVLALGAVVAIFGGCHFYARRSHTAIVLALSEAGAIILAAVGVDFGLRFGVHLPGPRFFGVMFGSLVLLDVIGAQLAVHAYNQGVRPSRKKQALIGFFFVTAASLVATGVYY